MKWYLATGPEGDVVISTRIRLARNIAELPFPGHMTREQNAQVIREVSEAAKVGGDFLKFTDMERLTPARAMSLAECHLVSPEFAKERDGRALLLSADEDVSIMVNEEDHVRIQIMLPGLQAVKALEEANRVDDLLDERLHYAFDAELGYLTRCPTNLGTGLRASVMLHLPALTQAGVIQNLMGAVAKLGLTVRGSYGEGSKPRGAFYQISNQVTLGITEKEAADKLESVVRQIITQERQAREALKSQTPAFEDKVFRSLGILRSARLLSGDEFMELVSDVRLGVAAGTIEDVKLEALAALIHEAQPATMCVSAGKTLDAAERDAMRAEIVRKALAA